jgi:hypothetical protein
MLFGFWREPSWPMEIREAGRNAALNARGVLCSARCRNAGVQVQRTSRGEPPVIESYA